MAQPGTRIKPTLCGFLIALLHPAAHAAIADDTGRWTLGIGDPTIYGWATVCAYVIAGVLAGRNARASWRREGFNWFWSALALLCLLLAVNKQLDLQSWLTQWGRDIALTQGWYEQRIVMQKGMIYALALCGFAASIVLRARLAEQWRDHRLAAIGAVLLTCFVIIRAATFHHVDELLALQFHSLKANFIFECLAIALIGMGALQWHKLSDKHR
jgi:MFS family permease